MPTNHAARPQALGYLYQVRFALYLILIGPNDAELIIEGLDDIEIQSVGGSTELLQLKHHVTPSSITDSQPAFWKSLLIWIEELESREISLEMTRFNLVTTANPNEGSALRMLSAGTDRDVVKAVQLLDEIAQESESVQLRMAFDKYLSLSTADKERLLGCITVIGNSPTILDVRNMIVAEVLRFSVRPEHIDPLYDRLEGWWEEKVIRLLSGEGPSYITAEEVANKLFDLRDQFRPTSLPIDYETSHPPQSPNPEVDNRLFVMQLKEIDLPRRSIEYAIIDYYRAFEQRSRWVREDLVFNDELTNYEDRLIEEWDRYRLTIEQSLDGANPAEDALVTAGRDIYNWVEHTAELPIREEVRHPFIWRGSYHMLATSNPPRVWWHPQFMDRLEAILLGGGVG